MSHLSRMLLPVLLAFAGTLWVAPDAEAKRLGGSRSFGMNRDSGAMRQAAPAPTSPSAPSQAAPAPQPSPVAAPQAPRTNRWLGPLAGLAAGIGLAALLSHFGLSPGLADFLLVGLLVAAAFFAYRMFSRRQQPAYHGLSAAGGAPLPRQSTTDFAGTTGSSAAASVPAGFDSEGFLRQAKLSFIRLQAANDAGNLDDLRQFLAPEVFAEVQLDYECRGKTRQETDVQQLDAQLLEVVSEDNLYIASIRFSGLIREDGGAPGPFAEIWHLAKPVSGERGWQVAGIQQIA